MSKSAVIADLKRVAELLGSKSLSRGIYQKHGRLSSATAEKTFGSWNEAVSTAGLVPLPSGGLSEKDQRNLVGATGRPSDAELLDALVALTKELGRRPSGNQLTAKGKYSAAYYIKRWGSVAAAYEAAESR